MAAERAAINGAIVGGGLEAKVGESEDAGNMGFPKSTRFGVALKGMLDRKDFLAVDVSAKTIAIPVSVGIVNKYVCRTVRWGGVGVSVFGVATVDVEVK